MGHAHQYARNAVYAQEPARYPASKPLIFTGRDLLPLTSEKRNRYNERVLTREEQWVCDTATD